MGGDAYHWGETKLVYGELKQRTDAEQEGGADETFRP